MKQYKFSRIALLVTILTGVLFASSCDKDDVGVNSSQTELLSFGPTGAKHGDTIRFIGRNLQKVNSIEFVGATVPKFEFKSHTAELITLLVPTAAEKGKVTLKTDDSSIVSKTVFNLDVTATIASMTAKARPGENITINGTYLNWVSKIVFFRNKEVTNFVSKTQTQLVVTVPADAQTGTLVIFYGGTDSAAIETKDTLKVTLPVATAMAPNPVKHAENLTITGTDLDLVKQVTFNGVTTPISSFVSQSATQLVVKVPAGAKTGKLQFTVASGVTVSASADLQVLLPAITSLSPNPIDPLANLSIKGTNLNLVTAVSFTGIVNPVTSFVSHSSTEIVVKVPTGTLKGKVTLSVLNSTLTVESTDVLEINGGLPPLPDFPYALYTDALQNGFQNWSWAGNDFNSTQIVRQGSTSIKATYGSGGYEGITFHNDAGPATDGYTKLEFSIFGTVGTGGKTMNVVINGGWGSPAQVTIVEGAWTTYSLNISSLSSPNPLKEVVLQSAGWSGVVHIDHVGLR